MQDYFDCVFFSVFSSLLNNLSALSLYTILAVFCLGRDGAQIVGVFNTGSPGQGHKSRYHDSGLAYPGLIWPIDDERLQRKHAVLFCLYLSLVVWRGRGSDPQSPGYDQGPDH